MNLGKETGHFKLNNMIITTEFKKAVREAVLESRKNYGGSDAAFSKTLGISPSIFSRLKSGEVEKIVSDSTWLEWGRKNDVQLNKSTWKIARTRVYEEIESNLNFCKEFSKSMILVDDNGIGKTCCSKHIAKQLKNTFYFDCSQAKTKQLFIRTLAQTVGVESTGKFVDVKANLKYYLNLIEKPLVVLDEVGDLEYSAFLEIKELWNGTEGTCAWYMMGAAGLRSKINKGINREKNGYAEIFDRFSDEFVKLVPNGREDKMKFYAELIGDVASKNTNKSLVPALIKKCVSVDGTKSLRTLETLIQVAG